MHDIIQYGFIVDDYLNEHPLLENLKMYIISKVLLRKL